MTKPKIHSVLVASLVSQEEPWIQRFLDCLTRLDYPRNAIRHAFVEGKNIGENSLLHEWAKADTWIKEASPQIPNRFEKLAHLRNLIIDEAYPIRSEDYILWIDSDVVEFPPSLIKDLMKHDVPVVAPSVWIEGTSQFYDTLAFRDTHGRMVPAFNFLYKGLVEMGSVGTCYLVDAKLYSQMNIRYCGGDSEQVMFCSEARKLEQKVYADFDIRIKHANLPWYGCRFH